MLLQREGSHERGFSTSYGWWYFLHRDELSGYFIWLYQSVIRCLVENSPQCFKVLCNGVW